MSQDINEILVDNEIYAPPCVKLEQDEEPELVAPTTPAVDPLFGAEEIKIEDPPESIDNSGIAASLVETVVKDEENAENDLNFDGDVTSDDYYNSTETDESDSDWGKPKKPPPKKKKPLKVPSKNSSLPKKKTLKIGKRKTKVKKIKQKIIKKPLPVKSDLTFIDKFFPQLADKLENVRLARIFPHIYRKDEPYVKKAPCYVCGKIFANSKMVVKHLEDHPGMEKLKVCKKCGHIGFGRCTVEHKNYPNPLI